MIALSQNEKEVIVSFPKELIDLESVKKFIERIELEELAKKSELNIQNIDELSSEINSKWWNKNGENWLKGEV